MDNKKIQARNGVFKQDSKKDNNSNPRQYARRRESTNSKSSQDQQLRNGNNNNTSNGSQYRNNSERRARWSRGGGGNNNSHVPRTADQPDNGGGAGLADADDDEEDELFLEAAEWDSVLVPGSKKHNLNHLLNFHYAPRDRDIGMRSGNKRRDHQKDSSKSTGVGQYNKDQFLQANCNFIVKERGDYKAHWNNPDTLVDWQLIEEVVIRSSEEPQCPICLFPPVAAKMTKCGHVYCWPCILHYLALSDKEWRKCPICYDAVHIKDLRSTVSWPYHEYQTNESVDFQLMCRRKGSLDVIKVGQRQNDQFPHLFSVRDQQIVHSKLILANQMEVSSVLDRERCELEQQMRTDGPEGFNCPEMMFIQQALDLLETRAKENAIPPNETTTTVEDEKLSLYDGLPLSESDAEDYHYFYQAVDGQHLYMHSVNNRMLQTQFGSLANCPPIVTGKIVQREHFSVSDALRKRTKYLQHLPLTSIITIVEIAFMGDLFSAEVTEMFGEELNQRKRDRQRRARDEKKREKHINELNDRQMGKMMAQNAGFVREEVDYYPFLATDTGNQLDQGSLEGESCPSAGSPNKPFSFAKMLQCASEIEKTQPEFWPSLENRKAGGAAWGGVNLDPVMDAAGPSARDNKPRASKLDRHFPNLLDTIEVEEDHEIPSAVKSDEGFAERVTDSNNKGASSKSGPKGNNHAAGSSKRAPKKKKWVVLDMNFNRN